MATEMQKSIESSMAENNFLFFLREAEGVKSQAYKSLEGGNDTIGIGHKLTDAETKAGMINIGGELVDYKQGLSDVQMNALAKQDIKSHKSITQSKFDKKYGKGEFNKLPADSQYMLVDYQYNLGDVMKFPKMVEAIKQGKWGSREDKSGVEDQYKRYFKDTEGTKKELSGRNDLIFNKYIQKNKDIETVLNQDKGMF